MKTLLNSFSFCIIACLFCSCTLNISTRVADYAREYECVRLDGPVWHSGDTFYVQGYSGQYRRCPELIQWAISPGVNGTFARLQEIEEHPSRIYEVDGNIDPRWFTKHSSWYVQRESGILAPAELPSGAVLVDDSLKLADVIPTGKYEVNLNACWAYPVSVACFVAVDIPCAVLSMFYYVLSTPFIEMGIDPYPDWF